MQIGVYKKRIEESNEGLNPLYKALGLGLLYYANRYISMPFNNTFKGLSSSINVFRRELKGLGIDGKTMSYRELLSNTAFGESLPYPSWHDRG